MTVLRGHDHL
jgi:hypothetical protein